MIVMLNSLKGLFSVHLGTDVLTVQIGDYAQWNLLRTFRRTSTRVGTSTKTFGIHLVYHRHHAGFTLGLALGKA